MLSTTLSMSVMLTMTMVLVLWMLVDCDHLVVDADVDAEVVAVDAAIVFDVDAVIAVFFIVIIVDNLDLYSWRARRRWSGECGGRRSARSEYRKSCTTAS